MLTGPLLVFGGSLTAGALLTFLMCARPFLTPARNLAVDIIDKYENARASDKRVGSVLTDGGEPS